MNVILPVNTPKNTKFVGAFRLAPSQQTIAIMQTWKDEM